MQANLERFWARLLTDSELRTRFLADAASVAKQEGLSSEESAALANMRASDLLTAARSYEFKRNGKRKRPRGSWMRQFL